MAEENLKSSTVVRAAQRPTMMMFVPLDIFLLEGVLMVVLIRFIGLWALAFLPLHAIPVLLTQRDAFWPKTIRVHFTHYISVGNRWLRGRGVTFNAQHLRTKAKPDDLPE